MESGRCKVLAETTNASFQWRFLAAAMGIPFIPSRNLLGTDTFEKSSVKMVCDPYGDINTTVIGDWHKPKARLPGSGGANDLGSLYWQTIILMRQDEQRFVEKLPFVTTPGYLGGP